ncbi:DUF2243 domain-containing protein [Streptomyces sp. NPDC002734]|uniref:DUF2243 domain-containing protein n=1 Tax=Streptomyces sp. NPDC002734 TaxID=3154426 RepID=UPI00331C1581
MTREDGARALTATPSSLRLPGILLGAGLGGFVDGILLHQILRWHHLLSSTDQDRVGIRYYDPRTVPGLEMNTVWDGVFHALCWLLVLAGLAVLYGRVTHDRRAVWTSPVLWGWVLFGWGVFNIVEGLLNHQILGVHHVRAGEHQAWWDAGFLVLGVLLLAVGHLVRRRGRAVDPSAPREAGRTAQGHDV